MAFAKPPGCGAAFFPKRFNKPINVAETAGIGYLMKFGVGFKQHFGRVLYAATPQFVGHRASHMFHECVVQSSVRHGYVFGDGADIDRLLVILPDEFKRAGHPWVFNGHYVGALACGHGPMEQSA